MVSMCHKQAADLHNKRRKHGIVNIFVIAGNCQETRWGRCLAPWCRQLALQIALGSRGGSSCETREDCRNQPRSEGYNFLNPSTGARAEQERCRNRCFAQTRTMNVVCLIQHEWRADHSGQDLSQLPLLPKYWTHALTLSVLTLL